MIATGHNTIHGASRTSILKMNRKTNEYTLIHRDLVIKMTILQTTYPNAFLLHASFYFVSNFAEMSKYEPFSNIRPVGQILAWH